VTLYNNNKIVGMNLNVLLILLLCIVFTTANSLQIIWFGEVRIQENFIVTTEDILIIQSNTTVVFKATNIAIVVQGVIQVNGSEDATVSIQGPIVFEDSANLEDSYIHYAVFSNGTSIKNAVSVTQAEQSGSVLLISNCIFSSTETGITASNTSIAVTNSTFQDVTNGIIMDGFGDLTFSENRVIKTKSNVTKAFFSLNNCTSDNVYEITGNTIDFVQTILSIGNSCSKMYISNNVWRASVAIDAKNLDCSGSCNFALIGNTISGKIFISTIPGSNITASIQGNVLTHIGLSVESGSFIDNRVNGTAEISRLTVTMNELEPFSISNNVLKGTKLVINGDASHLEIRNNTFYSGLDVCGVTGIIDLRRNDFNSQNIDTIHVLVKDFRHSRECTGVPKLFPAMYKGELVKFADIDIRTEALVTSDITLSEEVVFVNGLQLPPGIAVTSEKTVYLLGVVHLEGTDNDPITWHYKDKIIAKISNSEITDNQEWISGSKISHVEFISDTKKYPEISIESEIIYIEYIKVTNLNIHSAGVIKNSDIYIGLKFAPLQQKRSVYAIQNTVTGLFSFKGNNDLNIIRNNTLDRGTFELSQDNNAIVENNEFKITRVILLVPYNHTTFSNVSISNNKFTESIIEVEYSGLRLSKLSIVNNKFFGYHFFQDKRYNIILDTVVRPGLQVDISKNDFLNASGMKLSLNANKPEHVEFKLNIVENRFISNIHAPQSVESSIFLYYPPTDKPVIVTIRQNVFQTLSKYELELNTLSDINANYNYWGTNLESDYIRSRILHPIVSTIEHEPFFLSSNVYDFSEGNLYPFKPLPTVKVSLSDLTIENSTDPTKKRVIHPAMIVVPIVALTIFVLVVITIIFSLVVLVFIVRRSMRKKQDQFIGLGEPLNDYYRLNI
jgi:hypothetical protein